MRKIRAIAVDDEPLALDVIETYIEQIPEIELIAKCKNAIEANHLLKNEEVDLLLLDIQMPQITGIEFVKTLNNPPLVIFTTAYPNYAVEGFEVNAIDYLVKPISMDRFMKAINKAVELIRLKEHEKESNEKANGAATSLSAEEEAHNFIYVKADKKLIKVAYDEIYYIEGLKDYVIIKRANDRIITLQTMKSLDKRLPPHQFQRIHRSYIVALNKIDAVVGNQVEMEIAGKRKSIPIGKIYRDELLDIVNQNRL